MTEQAPALGASACGQLLERAGPLAELHGWAREASRSGRVVLVAGEAGVGKTSLVGAFLTSLPVRTPVLRGWCESLSTPRPLAPLLDVADQLGGPLARAVVTDARPPDVVGPLLRTLGARPGTALVVEDLHWADDATLDLVRLASRRIGEVPALVVVTYRDDEVGPTHPLRELLGDLGTRDTVRRLSLSPLTEGAVAQLAVGSGQDPVELFRLTAGNPFYVTEALHTGVTGVPRTVRDAVLARAARLAAPARRALDVAAVLGTPLDVDVLRAVAGDDAPCIDECAEAGVLRAEGDRVAFRHELARRAIEGALPPGRRRDLHAAVLRHLVATDDSPAARLAHHAAAAGDRSAVRRYAERAARQAAQMGAHREAAAQFRRVLEVTAQHAVARRADLLLAYSRECSVSDQPGEALASAEEALRLYRGLGYRRHEGDTLAFLGRLAWMCERTADALPWSREAIEVLEQLPPGPELARAYAQRARLDNNLGALESSASWARRARELADSLGETPVVVDAMIDLGLSRAASGADVTGGGALLTEAVHRARRLGYDEAAARGLFQLARVAWEGQRMEAAEGYARAGAAFAGERGAEMFHDYCLALRSLVLLELGRWEDAEALARQIWERTTPRSSATRTVMVCLTLGRLDARRGTRDGTDFLGIVDGLIRSMPRDPGLGRVAAQAERAWLAGRLPEMVEELRAAVAQLSGDDDPVGRGALAEACWWLRAAGEDVQPLGSGPFVAQTAGDWRAAAEEWAESGCPYQRAQALAQADLEEPLREALAICRELGAGPLGRWVARRLRALGVRDLPRASDEDARQRVAGITAREHEVLTLVADGLRDAEIAERLVISLRTAHHHVAAIRTKLDAPSRTAAVAAAVRLGLLAPGPGEADAHTADPATADPGREDRH